MDSNELIKAFRGLYSGGLAQERRNAGDPTAMPPWAETYWLGKQVVKSPPDLWVYQEIIVETKPDLIIETGTSGGGSAFYFATLMDLIGHGEIVTVDKDHYPDHWRVHPRIEYIIGDSVDINVVEQIRSKVKGKTTMLSLDSLHTREHVGKELEAYADLVSPGFYCVVEDVYVHGHDDDPEWCESVVKEFIDRHPNFVRDLGRERHLLTSNLWLRRTS